IAVKSKSKLHRREFLAAGGGAVLASIFSGKASAALSCIDATPAPNRDRPQAAVSLRETIKLLKAGKPPIFESITRLDGYAIDDANNDIALFGMVEPGQPPLRIDDFAIALRSAFTRGDVYRLSPAISLDPDERFFESLNDIKTTTAEGRRRYEKLC